MADAWIDKATAQAGRDAAFVNREMEMTPEIVGRVSPYHSKSGLHLVQALIAAASGERERCLAAVQAFAQTVAEPCAERDLTLGRSGTVLASALLLEELPDQNGDIGAMLRDAGTQRLETLWSEITGFDPLTHCPQWSNLGIAHGWAGLLYTTLRWHVATGTPLPAPFEDKLAQLFACGRPRERGLEWPWRQGADYRGREMAMPGWCNGAAGFVYLACLAHRVLKDARWLDAGIGAGWQSWEGGAGPVDLCCGLAGRAHALLDLHRATGETVWLTRAHALIDRAVTLAPDMRTKEHPRHSLYKGELGLALTVAEFDAPAQATMAVFGEAGRG
jgi:serine/threonine-protein kinase